MRDRIERGFAAWGHRVYRHAWVVTIACFAAALSLATQLPKIELDTSTEGLLKRDDPVRVAYDAFRHQFGRDERVVIAIRPPEVFDLGFLEKLRELHREIESRVPKLQEVSSLINARRTRGERDELIVGDLLERWPTTAGDLAALREEVLGNPLYRNLLISEDGRVTTVTIETDAYSSLGTDGDELAGFDDSGDPAADGRRFLTGPENSEIVAAIESIVARYRAPDFQIYLAGTPIMIDHLNHSMVHDMVLFTALALLAIAALLALLFRHAVGVVLPLLISTLSLICTLSLMAMVDIPISLPSQILPSFLLAVGVGNSVHVLVIFFQRRNRGDTREDAIAFALGHSALAIVMTALTTAGGLLSFSVAELAPIAQFGICAPVGVLLALLFTIVLLPALIALLPIGGSASESAFDRLARRLLVGCGDFATRHAAAIVLSASALLAASLLGVLQVRFSHHPLQWFPEDDYFRISSEEMNRSLKGMMFLEVLVDSGEENGLHDPELLERLDQMRRFSSRIQKGDIFVGKTVSVADVLKEIHQALNQNRSEFYTIPRDRALVAQELLLFENSGSDDLEDLVDSQFRLARFTMKMPFVDAIQYAPFYQVLAEGFSGILGDRARFSVTGLLAVLGKTFTAVMYSMASSYLVAFVVITPMMVLLIGRIRIGLLSMIPNLAPILLTLGLMGWLDLPLDAFTLLIGSIALGLAVDDTIHFMHNFRRYHRRTGSVEGAVRETLTSTGQAMLFTSLVLAAGFFIYALASMRNLCYFGLLTGFTIITAFLADVVLAPALMMLAMGRLPAPEVRAQGMEGT